MSVGTDVAAAVAAAKNMVEASVDLDRKTRYAVLMLLGAALRLVASDIDSQLLSEQIGRSLAALIG